MIFIKFLILMFVLGMHSITIVLSLMAVKGNIDLYLLLQSIASFLSVSFGVKWLLSEKWGI